MKVAIIGVGYVGLVTGACFAEMGNDVVCVDTDNKKIENLNNGRVPIYEIGLEDIIKRNCKDKRLKFITDIKLALENSKICFIAVGTPMGEDGSADLQYVLSVAKDIGKYMQSNLYVVDKSTVPVGTADKVKNTIQTELNKRNIGLKFSVISNPEFLKEGSAVSDCMKPDRVVIGTDNDDALHVMTELYKPFVRNTERFISMDIKSAEMTKYAANSMLATKISFINEMSNICEKVGADINKVRLGIGSDSRIGYSFIYPGCGYGGSCFPKDIEALIKTAENYGYDAKILKSVEQVNQNQKLVIVQKIIARFGDNLKDKIFAVWGLSFKPETDDMRESSAITIINELTNRGAFIKAYDPKTMEASQKYYLKDNINVEYVDSKYTALKKADALILITEWKEFRSPDFDEMSKRLNNKIIFDGRNQYAKDILNKLGFEYYQIGVAEN